MNRTIAAVIAFMMLSVTPALAQTAINQARALKGVGGCDAPGFPVTLCQSGSYKLTGNLLVPDTGVGISR
jgi:hypothetical protein